MLKCTVRCMFASNYPPDKTDFEVPPARLWVRPSTDSSLACSQGVFDHVLDLDDDDCRLALPSCARTAVSKTRTASMSTLL